MLFGSGKREFIDQIRKNISGNADCPRSTLDNNETIIFEYVGNNIELNKIEYKITGRNTRTLIEFTVNKKMGNDYPYYFNTPKFYSDSTLINGAFFSGLPKVDDVFYSLYNFNYGFLKIQFNGGRIWLLKI